MNEKDFFEVCYKRFVIAQEQSDSLYQRAGLLLTALAIVGAASYGIGRPELLPKIFVRIDVFFFLAFSAFTFVCLCVGVFFLILGITPRQYASLPPMREWESWRQEYRKILAGSGNKPNEDDVSRECLSRMKTQILDAECDHAKKNEIRRKHFRRAVLCCSLGFCGLAIQAFLRMILFVQGQ
jgi:hypothetical protein